MAVLELLRASDAGAADRALVGVYGWMAVMETVGFAAFFRRPARRRGRRWGDGADRRVAAARRVWTDG